MSVPVVFSQYEFVNEYMSRYNDLYPLEPPAAEDGLAIHSLEFEALQKEIEENRAFIMDVAQILSSTDLCLFAMDFVLVAAQRIAATKATEQTAVAIRDMRRAMAALRDL